MSRVRMLSPLGLTFSQGCHWVLEVPGCFEPSIVGGNYQFSLQGGRCQFLLKMLLWNLCSRNQRGRWDEKWEGMKIVIFQLFINKLENLAGMKTFREHSYVSWKAIFKKHPFNWLYWQSCCLICLFLNSTSGKGQWEGYEGQLWQCPESLVSLILVS